MYVKNAALVTPKKPNCKCFFRVWCLLFCLCPFFFISCSEFKGYEFIGKYKCNIVNQKKFHNTYFCHHSYGYIIGRCLPLDAGLKIVGADSLKYEDEYIITHRYPIKKVLISSSSIRGESLNTSKKALEVVLDKKKPSEHIFIYRINDGGNYRVLTP